MYPEPATSFSASLTGAFVAGTGAPVAETDAPYLLVSYTKGDESDLRVRHTYLLESGGTAYTVVGSTVAGFVATNAPMEERFTASGDYLIALPANIAGLYVPEVKGTAAGANPGTLTLKVLRRRAL